MCAPTAWRTSPQRITGTRWVRLLPRVHSAEIVEDGLGYQKVKSGRQVDLSEYLADTKLRSKIGFATADIHEDLHWEQSYEFIIPQDDSVTIRIFGHRYHDPDKSNNADQSLSQFQEVIVQPGELLIIHPQYCHRVMKKNRFIALKVEGKYKILAKKHPDASGRCPNTECSLWEQCEEIGRGS